MATFLGGAAGIIGECAWSHLVVDAGHGRFPSGLQLVDAQIDSAAAVMFGTGRGIGNEDLFVLRRSLPKHFGHVPRAVGVMDHHSISGCPELLVGADESLCRRTLQKRATLRIHGSP